NKSKKNGLKNIISFVVTNRLLYSLTIESYFNQQLIKMLNIKKLHKSYPIGDSSLHVLKGIDLSVDDGEMVAIMGSSGSGKSTLLNIIGMLDEADEGEYILDGVPIKNLTEKKAAIYRNKFLGFIFQSFNLINYKNALDNVALPLYYQGMKRQERQELAMFHLGKVGLKP